MKLILLEWKLIIRNKRTKQQFLIYNIFFPLMIYWYLLNDHLQSIFVLKEIFLCFIFILSANFASNALNVNASFIEKQMSMSIPIFNVLQAKYRLYCLMSLILFIVFLPSLFFKIKIIELVAALVYSIGLFYCGTFYASIFSHKAFDIKGANFANYQGYGFTNYIYTFLIMLVCLGFILLSNFIWGNQITLTLMIIIGLFFIATQKIWLKHIAKKFDATKYKRLENFREYYAENK